MASARWQYPATPTADQLAQKESMDKEEPPKSEGYNIALHEEFFGAIAKAEDKWVDNSKDYGKCRTHAYTVKMGILYDHELANTYAQSC